jgi:hypothetical protein
MFVFYLLAFENGKPDFHNFFAAACGSSGEQLSQIWITYLDRYFSHVLIVKNQAEKTTVSAKKMYLRKNRYKH